MTARARALACIGWLALSSCEPQPRAPEPAVPPSTPAPAPAPAAEDEPAPSAAPKDALCASAEQCFEAASQDERAQHPERAAPLYMRACELGIGQACHRLGVMHLEGKGVARDDGKARELFEVGCRQDSTAACDALGH